MWLPLLIPCLSYWYCPNFTIYYNVLLSAYIITLTLLGDASCLITLLKVRANTHKRLQKCRWINSCDKNSEKSNETLVAAQMRNILHLIVIPIYQEHGMILETILQSLSVQRVPMIVGLALEELDRDSDTKYNHIIRKFENRFLNIKKTRHPTGIKHEIQGRGSNCDYCVRELVKLYEKTDLKMSYPYAMITICDVDTVWSTEYFLHLNDACEKNGMENFDSIVYTPVITNLKYFQSYNMLANWVSMNRFWYFQGHFRFFGIVRCLINAFHIPLNVLQNIDYFDTNYNCDDVRIGDKIAILNKYDVSIKQLYLPCDNQTPTSSSMSGTFILLWKQTIRWNLSMQEIYYLVHQFWLNILKVKRYRNFQASSWKIAFKLVDNYESMFFYPLCFLTNGMFWLIYSYFFNQSHQPVVVYHLLNHILPMVMIIQAILTIVFGLYMFTFNDVNTRGHPYSLRKQSFFLLGAAVFPYLIMWFIGITLILAWLKTLRALSSHGDSAAKIH